MHDKKIKPDLCDRSNDEACLTEAKQQEEKLKSKLKHIPILNGYVLTTNESKWNQHYLNNNRDSSTGENDHPCSKIEEAGEFIDDITSWFEMVEF